MAGHIDARNLILVPFCKFDNIVFTLKFKDRQCRVLIYTRVRRGISSSMACKASKLEKVLPVKTISQIRCIEISIISFIWHKAFLLKNLGMGVLLPSLIHIRAMITAIIRYKDSNGSSAFPRFVWMFFCVHSGCSIAHLRLDHIVIRLIF